MGFRTGSIVWEQTFCLVAIDCNLVEVTIYKEFYWGSAKFQKWDAKKEIKYKGGDRTLLPTMVLNTPMESYF